MFYIAYDYKQEGVFSTLVRNISIASRKVLALTHTLMSMDHTAQ